MSTVHEDVGIFKAGITVKQPVDNVTQAAPTKAELTTAFGDPTTLGRGFIGTLDDNDADTDVFLIYCSDANFFWLKGTKAL